MSDQPPPHVTVCRQPRTEAGSCNSCQDRLGETVLSIGLKTANVRLCDRCATVLGIALHREVHRPPTSRFDWNIETPKTKTRWHCQGCGYHAEAVSIRGAKASIDAKIRRETGGAPLCRHKQIREA